MTAIRAEWLKFRTVRGWVIALLVAAAAVAGLGLLGEGDQGSCFGDSCTLTPGPGGEAVSDSFYLVHQALTGNGSITVRVTSLTSAAPEPGKHGLRKVTVPWAKAGIILKDGLGAGSPYVAIMVTGSNGVRLQDNYTGDIAGPALNAGWLRLTREGETFTGYASAAGRSWTRVGSVTLSRWPASVPGGLFTTSPQVTQASLGVAQITGYPSQSTATFDHLTKSWPAGTWTGTDAGGGGGLLGGPPDGYTERGGTFTVTGSGDIAPVTYGPAGIGATVGQALGGVFLALALLAVVGVLFSAAEYRRGLIRVTLAACPRRGRVLAAKVTVIGLAAFAAGLAGAVVAVPLGQRALRGRGVYLPPVTALTDLRVIVGVAVVLALCAVLAVAAGAVARRGAVAVAAVVMLVVVPYVISVPIPVVPLGVADWLMRVTPAAAFAVEQTVTRYPQVGEVYSAAYGYFPLSPWAGLAVLCGWALAAVGLAYALLNRRDA